MRHRIGGRKLNRTSEHRIALLRNLSTSLFDKERITTTLVKAKELRPFAEKLITLAKKETLHSKRQVLRHIQDKTVAKKLFDTLSARFSQRPGGYMRILHLGPRRGDGAEMAILELIGSEPVFEKDKKKKKKEKKAKVKEEPTPEAEAAEEKEEKKKPKRKGIFRAKKEKGKEEKKGKKEKGKKKTAEKTKKKK
jgi:large subunit ribosomal protein L17